MITLLNAHASKTPHLVGQVAKAEILVAHLLDTAPPGTDTQRRAAVIVDQLQTQLGWTPPRDLTEAAPLRPDQPASEDSPGRREFAAARAALAARNRRTT